MGLAWALQPPGGKVNLSPQLVLLVLCAVIWLSFAGPLRSASFEVLTALRTDLSLRETLLRLERLTLTTSAASQPQSWVGWLTDAGLHHPRRRWRGGPCGLAMLVGRPVVRRHDDAI
jgi:hypothetical protein